MNNVTRHYPVVFNYQSQNIDFAEWISLTTLCLGPLLVHLFAGTPQPVYLDHSRPKWHETIVHYNPTAIIWRYFAITDRRMRARNWNPVDMAAGNALFWTERGWDGSVEMMVKSRALCMQTPPSTLKRLFSSDALKTAAVALQGAQAIYVLAGRGLGFKKSGSIGFAVDLIFLPIAVVGLLRLFAALWLTDDRLFKSDGGDGSPTPLPHPPPIVQEMHMKELQENLLPSSAKPQFIQTTQIVRSDSYISHQFRPALSLPGLSIRFLYIAFLSFCLLVDLRLLLLKVPGARPVSNIITGCYYAILILITIGCYMFYFIRDRGTSSSTVLPCITTMWFKLYTGAVFFGCFLLFVFAALETRRMPCGTYTTYDASRDQVGCPGVIWVGNNSTSA